MFKLNPTIFKINNEFYSLIRCESDVVKWNNSELSYNFCKLDEDFNVLTTELCTFKINENIFKGINRKSLKKDNYCIEDIKILKYNLNNKIVGIANVLIQQKPYRIFRLGLIEFNVDTKTIELIKILEVDNMNNNEKNWLVLKHNNKFLIIYSLFPKCKIYELNITTFKMNIYKEFNTQEIINKYDYLVKDLNKYYLNFYFTPSGIIKNNNDGTYILIVKVRKSNNNYCYYKLILNLTNDTVDLIPELLFTGFKYYLNDILIQNNKIIGCFGVGDKVYEIKYLHKVI